MRRPRSGVGAELVPLVLILACLAGSLMLIVAVHRRAAPRRPVKPVVAVVVAPPPPSEAKPIPAPPAAVSEPEAPEPEPPGPPPPVDPTPKALAGFTAAEAEQLLEASRADRKAAAMEEARKAAAAQSERWRRRESMVNAQVSGLDAKVRKIEAEVDTLAFERDALLKERDARKAAIAQAKSRPGQAILPHKGPNGTWRRPIVVECTNGMAILRPQGLGFGLLELASGFGPSSNPFVAAVAREAVRIRRQESPDGAPVVPYIFFLVRPDGVRPYYEARGRLEPLGITFGYELADQDWEVDFPDLNETAAWDGSAPGLNPMVGTPPRAPGSSPAEDENLPAWGSTSRGNRGGTSGLSDAGFTWPGPKALARSGGGGGPGTGRPDGTGDRTGGRSPGAPGGDPLEGIPGLAGGPAGPSVGQGPLAGGSESDLAGPSTDPGGPEPRDGRGSLANSDPSGETKTAGPRRWAPAGRTTDDSGTDLTNRTPGPGAPSPGDGPSSRPNPYLPNQGRSPRDPGGSGIDLAGGPADPAGRSPRGGRDTQANPGHPTAGSDPVARPGPGSPGEPVPSATDAPTRPGGEIPGEVALDPPVPGRPANAGGKDAGDPGSEFVWPGKPKGGARGPEAGSPPITPSDDSPPVPHRGPFTRPLAMGVQVPPDLGEPASGGSPGIPPGSPRAGGSGDASGNKGSGGGPPARRMIGQAGGPGGQPPSGQPPQSAAGIGLGMPPTGSPSSGSPTGSPSSGSGSRSPALPEPEPGRIIDRRFEIVVVCGPRGVIVQPGGYRVTADALKDRAGLLKKQMVALVKARRAADPKVILEPKVRLLVQAGGEKTYGAARSQILLSGLDWPTTIQVAPPDPLAILPSEGW